MKCDHQVKNEAREKHQEHKHSDGNIFNFTFFLYILKEVI